MSKQDVLHEEDQQNENQLSAEEILEKYDRESTYRKNLGIWAWAVTFIGIAFTSFHLYTAYFGAYETRIQGPIHLGIGLGLIFLLYPIKKDGKKTNWCTVV